MNIKGSLPDSLRGTAAVLNRPDATLSDLRQHRQMDAQSAGWEVDMESGILKFTDLHRYSHPRLQLMQLACGRWPRTSVTLE